MTNSKEILMETATHTFYRDGSSVENNALKYAKQFLKLAREDDATATLEADSITIKQVEVAGYDGGRSNPTPFYIENGTKKYVKDFNGVIEL